MTDVSDYRTYEVVKAVDDYIDSVTETREPDGMWHPSSMYGCTRQAIYQIRGTEVTDPTDAPSKRRFYIGHRIHEAVQRALESSPLFSEFYAEFEVNGAGITGHGDALGKTLDGNWWVVEVKSIKKAGIRMGIPKEGHIQQGTTYAWLVRDYGCLVYDPLSGEYVEISPLGDKLAGLIIVYVEKEDLQIVEYTLPWDDAWRGAVKEQLVELEMYKADPESLPPRLPYSGPRKHWMCNYCAYASKCYKVDPAEVPPKIEGEF